MAVYPNESRAVRKPCSSNCETCDHHKRQLAIEKSPEHFTSGVDEHLHCYMFKDAPDGECYQHTGMPDPTNDFMKLLKAMQKSAYDMDRKSKL